MSDARRFLVLCVFRAGFHRRCLAAVLAAVLAAAVVVPAAWAEEPAAEAVDLPLESITLFSSGVGFFRHAGSVPAGGEVRLDFTADELNDVLKSLSLTGAGGGVSVSYPGRADLDQRLAGFGVDLRGVASRYDLLERLRGVEVRLTRGAGGTDVVGRVLGVQTRPVPSGEGHAAPQHFVTLATGRGLAELALDQVERLSLADERLAGEMAAALQLLAGARDTRKKPVTLRFGDAAPRVGVSYLQASPLWKLSYRLDLTAPDAGAAGAAGAAEAKAALQGWAIVDNTTDRDWDGVAVTLVSGRPVSFVQDLYAPEFLGRPVVRPERYAGLRPQSHDQDMEEADELAEYEGQKARTRLRAMSVGGGGSSLFGDGTTEVAAAATSGAVGELFAYTLSQPVTLARGESAMLPVVQDAVTARAVSVFNDRVQAKHPMRGVRLTNTTDLKLDAGPVTVLDGGTYAGDAQLGFLAPGADRLLTYAVDLEVVVDAQDRQRTVQTGGRFDRGVLILDRRQEISRTYTLKNTAGAGRRVLVEHARSPSFELVDPPEGFETTGALYRLPVDVPAGATVTTTAKQVRVFEQAVQLGRLDDAQLLARAQGGSLPAGVAAQLKQAAGLKRSVSDAERELAQTIAAGDRIVEEQQRLRNNMKTLDRNNALYQRYLKKLNGQEDELEALGLRREDLNDALAQRTAAFEAFLAALR